MTFWAADCSRAPLKVVSQCQYSYVVKYINCILFFRRESLPREYATPCK